MATDQPLGLEVPVPVLDLNDPAAIGDFIERSIVAAHPLRPARFAQTC